MFGMMAHLSPRRQGDLGELSAMEWLASQSYKLWLPVGHSRDSDLIAEDDDERLLRVQVKTTTRYRNHRWEVMICTRGGNQSWNGLVKRLSSASKSEEQIQSIRNDFLARLAEIDRSYPESERQELQEDFVRIQRFLDRHQKGAAGGMTEPQFLAGKAAGTQN